MKERLLGYKHIKPVAYIVFFVAVFSASLIITFPAELIKKRIISEIESNTAYKVDIEDAGISLLLSVNLNGVKLYKSKDRFLSIDSLSIRPSLLSLMSDSVEFPFRAKLLNGEVDGSVSFTKAGSRTKEIEATIKHLTIDSLPAFLLSEGGELFSLGGVVDGSMHVQLEPRANGEFEFEIDRLSMKDIKVKGFSLPSFTDLKSVVKGNIDGSKTNILAFNVTGKDIDLEITGTTPLVWEISKGGVIDIGYRLQIKGDQMAKYKGLLTPYLATQRDGSLGGKILGTMKNPRFEKDSTTRF